MLRVEPPIGSQPSAAAAPKEEPTSPTDVAEVNRQVPTEVPTSPFEEANFPEDWPTMPTAEQKQEQKTWSSDDDVSPSARSWSSAPTSTQPKGDLYHGNGSQPRRFGGGD